LNDPKFIHCGFAAGGTGNREHPSALVPCSLSKTNNHHTIGRYLPFHFQKRTSCPRNSTSLGTCEPMRIACVLCSVFLCVPFVFWGKSRECASCVCVFRGKKRRKEDEEQEDDMAGMLGRSGVRTRAWIVALQQESLLCIRQDLSCNHGKQICGVARI
jgi:hypothetical protein